jgi:hypothetical protein
MMADAEAKLRMAGGKWLSRTRADTIVLVVMGILSVVIWHLPSAI